MLAAGEWPATEPEPVQFWLSNLPADTLLTTLVRLAKVRWRIGHDCREMKQALGLAPFEGRTWNGWHHHVTLDSAAHAFCTLRRLARSPNLSLYQVVRELQLLLRSGPAPAPPVTATYRHPVQPDQALLAVVHERCIPSESSNRAAREADSADVGCS